MVVSHLGQDGDGPDGKGVAGEGEAALSTDPDLGRAVPGARHQRPEPDINQYILSPLNLMLTDADISFNDC